MLARLDVRCHDCGRPCDAADNYCRRCGQSLNPAALTTVYDTPTVPARVFRALAPLLRPVAPVVRGAALVAAGAGLAVLRQRIAKAGRKPQSLELVAWSETIVTRRWIAKPGER